MYKSIFFIAAIIAASTIAGNAQINNAKTETVKVFGNCGMCEKNIENAASENRVSTADWNEETKMATITYNSEKTTLDAVLKNIALAGYDNQNFLAPDDVYNKLTACCKYERTEKQEAITKKLSSEPMSLLVTHTAETNQLKAVFASYFLLKDALVKTDATAASTNAKSLQTSINAVQMGKLATDVHVVWMKVLSELKEDATRINETKDISKQRDYFMRLSKNMYELIKIAKPTETVYYQFCPMANDGKGANWLSKENGIKNPYYGSQMLTCGKTVETIKQ